MRRLPLLSLLFLFCATPVSAFNFEGRAAVDGQLRENQSSARETPVNYYLGAGFKQEPWAFSGETDMRYYRDFNQKTDDYDLYQAVLHLHPLAPLQIDFGRQFVSEGLSASVVDGLRLQITPGLPITMTVYSGVPRRVERGDFNRNDGLLTGAALRLTKIPRTQVALSGSWRRDDFNKTDWEQNDQVFTAFSASHALALAASPLLYGLVEYDATGKLISNGSAGVDLTPADWASLSAEFDYYDVNRGRARDTIAALFSRGRTLSGRFSSTWDLNSYLSFVQTYAYQQVTIQPNDRRNAHLVESALEIAVEPLRLYLTPGFWFSESFGGRVFGGRLSVSEQMTEHWSADLSADFASYTKVTNNNDTATSVVLWSVYDFPKGWMVSGGFEYNKNNNFDNDVRGAVKLAYAFSN